MLKKRWLSWILVLAMALTMAFMPERTPSPAPRPADPVFDSWRSVSRAARVTTSRFRLMLS